MKTQQRKTNSQLDIKSVAEKLSSISKEIDSLKKENKETKNFISGILKHGNSFRF